MKVLLTGITGTIGSSILNALAPTGYEIICPVRSRSKAEHIVQQLGGNITLVELDQSLDFELQFYNIAKGIPNIIHSGFLMGPQDNEMESQVITGLVNAAKETSQTVEVFLAVTTGALCVGQNLELAGEDIASNANCLDLLRCRVAHEEMVLSSNSATLKASVVRPVCIYGGSFVDQYYKACKQLGKIIVPHGNGSVSYIHKTDLGRFYKLLLEHKGSGEFNVSEGLGPNLDEVIEIAKKVTGVQVVERIDNPWEHMGTYGFYLFELTLTSKLDSKRGRELFGFVPQHNFAREFESLLVL
jgi:nucleoside-diphosphate-sugar epimerase